MPPGERQVTGAFQTVKERGTSGVAGPWSSECAITRHEHCPVELS